MRYFLISLFIICGTANAEIYKWQDPSGRVGYGNVPPPDGSKYIELNVKPSKQKEVTPSDKPLSDQSAERERKISEDQEKLAKEAAQNCARSKESLQMLESGVRVVRYNAAGEREVLDDKARAAETQNAKKAIADWCTPEKQ